MSLKIKLLRKICCIDEMMIGKNVHQDTIRRVFVVGLVWLLISLNCARSFPQQQTVNIQETLIASSASTQEPAWFQELNQSQPSVFTEEIEPAATVPLEVEIRVPTPSNTPIFVYQAQSGDTLAALAKRFGVSEKEIESDRPLPPKGFIEPKQTLYIPNRLSGELTPKEQIIPDSDFVFGPSSVGFDAESYIKEAGGYLSSYRQWLESTRMTSGTQVIMRIALENSISPRLLLSILEYQSGWVSSQPKELSQLHYPIGTTQTQQKDLYHQLQWAANYLTDGYYGWREGRFTTLTLQDGSTLRISPQVNAATAALQYFFAQLYGKEEWLRAMDKTKGLGGTYQRLFGDPWMRADLFEPRFPAGIVQPPLSLPFERGKLWALTGGPHGAWEQNGSWAALDFAPGSISFGCVRSDAWVVASAPGIVTRSANGVVALDLDGDGLEQTGWVLVYLHIAKESRVAVGTVLDRGDRIGHPSCEGGFATGTHVHIARKYNGEWIAADGPLPFDLDGWVAHNGESPYKGMLTRGDESVIANTTSPSSANIMRKDDDL